MTLPRWIAPGAVAFVAVWLLLMAGGRDGMLRDPGTFWHTTTGEIILHDGFIRSDPYTFTFRDTWWVPYQWLGEVGMALAHRAGGFDTQFLGAVTILAAVFAFLAVRLLRTGLNFVAVGMVMVLALASAGSHFHVRPHLVTLAGMAGTVALLADYDAGRVRLRHLFWLVPFFVFWANVHGGYLGGFGTVVIAAGGWFVFWQLGRPSPVRSWRDVGWLALLVALGGAAALVNPYGTDMLKTWRIIMDEPILKQIIKEHRPLDLAEPYSWPVVILAAVYLFVLAGVNWREVRVSWLLPLVWLLQTIGRCRHASLFTVAALVAIAAIWPHTRWAKRLAQTRPDFYDPNAPPVRRPWWASVWLPVLAVLLSLGLQVGGVRVPVIGAGWVRHSSKHWPVEVLDALKANEPKPGEPNHLFNDYVDGGFVIYHAPGYKVFVDDRCEVFGGDWLLAFVKATDPDLPAERRAAIMGEWQAKYGRFDFALTRADTPFDEYFRSAPGWECVKRTASAAFYRRK
jgi:hypothetical protein